MKRAVKPEADSSLPLSVIICTFNRSELLKVTLESLTGQTLGTDKYEIIIIDDGSSDKTKQCVEAFLERLPIRYFFQKNAGLASAKNHGIYAAQGRILFFMDDDDLATSVLLEEHLKTHREYPDDNYAVLNYTSWVPDKPVTPIMYYVTEVGCFLFSYPYIKHGDVLDYTYFWGGRSSCKRSFLIEYGVFNPVFRFGCEDIELGYRLSLHGLKVVYNSHAISYMFRPVTLDDFCKRLIKQGRSQFVFSRLHDDPDVHKWAETPGAEEEWTRIAHGYSAKMRAARWLEKIANMRLQLNFSMDESTKRLLYEAYWWIFRACKLRGISEAAKAAGNSALSNTPVEGFQAERAAAADHFPEQRMPGVQGSNGNRDVYLSRKVAIDLTGTVDYEKLTKEEIDEYSNIEVTGDLREGGIHAQKGWGYWFQYLIRQEWKSSLGAEILQFCQDIMNPRILSLGCGYCGAELEFAKSLKAMNKQYGMTVVDINGSLFEKAKEEARLEGLNIHFLSLDLNFVEITEKTFDVIFAHASLHHILNLEHIFQQIYKGLKNNGRFIMQDIIGKSQVLFWKENVAFAREVVRKMPSKYKKGIADKDNIILPYNDFMAQKGMEGIRQEEIEEQAGKYFSPVKIFKYGSFIRMICTHPELGKRFDPDKQEDKEYLEYLFNLDLQQIADKKLRPTEMLAVFQRRETAVT